MQVLLELKYIREKCGQLRESLSQQSESWAFVFLGMGHVQRLSGLPPGVGLCFLPSGGKEVAQSHLSSCPGLFFSCWCLLLEIKSERGQSKGQWRISRAAGRGLSKGLRKNS